MPLSASLHTEEEGQKIRIRASHSVKINWNDCSYIANADSLPTQNGAIRNSSSLGPPTKPKVGMGIIEKHVGKRVRQQPDI